MTTKLLQLCGDALDSIGKVEAAMTGGPWHYKAGFTHLQGTEPLADKVWDEASGKFIFPWLADWTGSGRDEDGIGAALARNLLPGTVDYLRLDYAAALAAIEAGYPQSGEQMILRVARALALPGSELEAAIKGDNDG